ncbi:hypothetical protein SB11R_10185 [Pseudomonas oryzihabitans]|nr:hypothetical protein SB11R_10185 [Pseudomonas psychrotolerans]
MRKAIGIAAVCVALGACAVVPNEVSPKLKGLPGVLTADGPHGYPIVQSFTFDKPPLPSSARLGECFEKVADTWRAPQVTGNGMEALGTLTYPTKTQGYYEGVRYRLNVSSQVGAYRFYGMKNLRGSDFAAVEGMDPELAYAKFKELADQVDRCAR